LKLNSLYEIYWNDAKSEHITTLDEFLKKGFAKKVSIGWVVYQDKDKVVLCSEKDAEEKFKPDMSGDYTLVPFDWITKTRKLDGN